MTDRELMSQAKQASLNAYVPYSHFAVGAAVMTSDGEIYSGCNIENQAYSVTNCAERTAFFKAVSDGVRDFRAIAIVGGLNGVLRNYCAPCGVCRQAILEFEKNAPHPIEILLAGREQVYRLESIASTLPLCFKDF